MHQALLKITGKVQGVFFRARAAEQANKLGLTGHARNQPDGSVEILVQGEKSQIEKFIAWAHCGPELACVEKLEINWQEITQQKDNFQIL